jgi:ribosome-associated toxin RatA of RatAB toxin-antitoxin module
MRGQWQFDQVEDGTKVVFQSEVETDDYISAELISKIFRRVGKRIMKAFIRRAKIIAAST